MLTFFTHPPHSQIKASAFSSNLDFITVDVDIAMEDNGLTSFTLDRQGFISTLLTLVRERAPSNGRASSSSSWVVAV